jgi:hypothetical protein
MSDPFVKALVAAVFLACLVRSSRESIKFRAWAKADQERSLMFDKFTELCDDPTMTDQKWAEWVKVFEYVDECYEKNNSMSIPVNRLADLARRQIDDPTFLKGA